MYIYTTKLLNTSIWKNRKIWIVNMNVLINIKNIFIFSKYKKYIFLVSIRNILLSVSIRSIFIFSKYKKYIYFQRI